jgi:putative alpha-1,2-mannosidase
MIPGLAYKTQEKVREIARDNYHAEPDGLSGNDDCGQMSAWYIFTAFGFYPVNPPSATFVIASPMFEKVTLHLPGKRDGQPLVIKSTGATTKKYVRSLILDSVPITSAKDGLTNAALLRGKELVFEMADTPQKWG